MLTFSHQAQLADLGIALAHDFTSLAMSNAFAAVSVALTLPLAMLSVSRPKMRQLQVVSRPSKQVDADPAIYSAYRSDGGHATTLVIMQTLPHGA